MNAIERCDEIVKAGGIPNAATQIDAIDAQLEVWAGHKKLPVVDKWLDERLKLMTEETQ